MKTKNKEVCYYRIIDDFNPQTCEVFNINGELIGRNHSTISAFILGAVAI